MAVVTCSLRVGLFIAIFLTGVLHICVLSFPNWWWFDYQDWVQDTSGVLGTNGGLFKYCQHYRLLPGGQVDCFKYGDNGGELLDTSEALMPLGGAWRGAQACTIMSLLCSLPAAVLLAMACKAVRKTLVMRIATLVFLAQCLLMVAALGSAHQWIHTPFDHEFYFQDVYSYDYMFYCAGALCAIYMIMTLLAFWTSCMDTDLPEDKDDHPKGRGQGRRVSNKPLPGNGVIAEDV